MTRFGLTKLQILLPCVPLVFAACTDDTEGTGGPDVSNTGDGDGDGDGSSETGGTEGDGDGDPTGDGDGDPTGDGDGDCVDGEEECTVDGHQLCVDGTWTDDPCPADTFCDWDTNMCTPCACTPGEEGACVDDENIDTCKDDCSGWEPQACTNAICIVDTCVDLLCEPDQSYCTDSNSYEVCNGTGTGFGDEQDCGPQELCLSGECIDACLYAETTKSSTGCEFWAVDMANQPPRHLYTYAITIANPSHDDIATVQIWDKRIGAQVAIIEDTVDPRETKVFNVSGAHANFTSYYDGLDAGFLGSGIGEGTAFRVVTNVPVVATQFNPIGGSSSITAEASLLLPTHALAEEYMHLAWALGYGTGSALNVVATEDDTVVTITPNVNTPAGINGLPSMTAGQPTQVMLDAYDYIQIGIQDQNMEDMLQSMSGSLVSSNKPVAVFGGHSCANVPDEVISGCDHVEEQIFPLDTWGANYVASRNPMREDEPMRWRIIASKDDTTIDFEPPVDIGSQIILDSGQMIEFDEHQDFYVSADNPILMAGFMTGCASISPPCIGDPYMVLMIPVEQYQNDYVFLVDSSYTEDFAKLVRPLGAEVTVECMGVVPDNRWTQIGTSDWEWATIDINPGEAMCAPGTNQASSDQGFGVIVSGQSSFTSYAYPGGLALQQINPL